MSGHLKKLEMHEALSRPNFDPSEMSEIPYAQRRSDSEQSRTGKREHPKSMPSEKHVRLHNLSIGFRQHVAGSSGIAQASRKLSTQMLVLRHAAAPATFLAQPFSNGWMR